jgi:hypothetical protein
MINDLIFSSVVILRLTSILADRQELASLNKRSAF